MKKKCSKCKENLEIEAFALNKGSTDGRCKTCRSCQSKYGKEHYKKHRKEYIKRASISNRKRDSIVLEFLRWLKEIPCTDCKRTYPPFVMDFDHVHGTKKFGLGSVRQHLWNQEDVMLEIQKCEVVCSNCHRIRTWNRLHIGVGVGRRGDL